MSRHSTLFASVAPFAPALLALARTEPWKDGLDVSAEASAGLSGGAQRGDALHGLVLLHGDWTQTAPSTSGPAYTGYVSALPRAGNGPSERFLGDFLAASNSEGNPGGRLYSWWLSERLNRQPHLPIIRHPGGSTAQRNACVFLVRLNSSY